MLQPVKRVALTIDAWTTETQIPVLGITVHWIDEDFTLCERVLSVEEMVGPHTGENMADYVFKVIKDFLLVEKVCAIATDNASNNTTMIQCLSQLMKECDSSFNCAHHFPCIVHVVNLTVQDGLKQLGIEPARTEEELAEQILEGFADLSISSSTSLGKLLIRLRKLVTAIKMSPQRIARYRNMCEDLRMPNSNKLKVDCHTRWNSTFEMLVTAIAKKKVFQKMAEEVLNTSRQSYSITNEEWDLLNAFAKVLWPFKDATEMLSTSKSVSISRVIPYIEGIMKFMKDTITSLDDENSKVSEDQKAALRRAYEAMVEKFLKYKELMQQNPAYVIATVLDPQKKLTCFLVACHEVVRLELLNLIGDKNEARDTMKDSATEDVSWDTLVNSDILGTSSPPNVLSTYVTGENQALKRARATAEEEVDEYLSEGSIGSDPLLWWGGVGRFRFPKLASLAKDYLNICGTSTPAERLFSAGRGIVTYKRGRLIGETISVLLTLKCWAREDDIKEEEEKKKMEKS